ncbi:helix-turn-helix transcriptional regulator [Streptomyces sp. WAC06614]|uniref:helix-turn-helix transcriptional regulator n=1 Tax=Streptomyces sp. WAC06614 TaxID=2487416 RepID=UPI000F79265F|nr:helix-turn-helix transcriptional regulator [Streptomyces sp. WAC06614]RSS61306.1 AraC family transcriptional regulator [Streptomyces sp. WAC06614]
MDRDYAEPLDVPALAQEALMSPGHFSRSFRAAYGETPYSYLVTRRIERAKALLRRGDLTVTEVCFAVGCTSLGSFSSRFSELVGESPSAYRARDHEEGAPVPACIAKIHTRPVRTAGRNRADGSAGAGKAGAGDPAAEAGVGGQAAGKAGVGGQAAGKAGAGEAPPAARP